MAQQTSSPDPLALRKARELLNADLRRFGWALFAISGIISVLALTGSFYMLQVYDRALTSGSVQTLVFLSVLALALYLVQGGFDTIRSQVLVRIGARLDRRLAPLSHRVAIDMPRYGFSPAEALERSRSVDTLRNFLGSQAPGAIFDLPFVPIFLIFVYFLHPILGAVTLGGLVVLALLTVLAEVKSRDLAKAAQRALVLRNTISESNTRNSEVLIAMGVTGRAVERFAEANHEHLALNTKASDITGTMAAMSRVLRMLLQSGLLGLGAYLTIKGELSAGAIIAVSVASGRALAPIDQIIANWKGIAQARQAWGQLRDTLVALAAERKPVSLPAPRQSLRVENLTVASPANGRVLLSEVSFELQAGQALAIIGPSGGGKSTLIRALAGVWPVLRGTVRYDDVDLAQWDPARLGEIIGYLPQEVALLAGTVRDNISRFDPNRDSDGIFKAATAANVHKMISQLPDGYDTEVGALGTALSAGQRQRIGLARALYQDPFVVLLDEPNASLDAAGERALNDTIKAIRARGGIAVVVAHRPSVLAAVDMVAAIHAGRLAAFGTKEEVLGNRDGKVAAPVTVAGGDQVSLEDMAPVQAAG
ncbi:type I secretion system permease/ATPase [Tabrizicola sp. M-4]|uniref:type I secretion system permease/ATPase n=1 Tax=Tabrizicola sp. M-4 TaxID=3055847 RepID=UPI003DA83963